MSKLSSSFTLGLIGGITGIIGSLMAMMVGSLGSAFGASGAGTVSSLAVLALLFSVVGIVGASIVKHKHKLGGVFMILSSVGGLVSISFAYILSFVLLLIGGIMGVTYNKNKENDK